MSILVYIILFVISALLVTIFLPLSKKSKVPVILFFILIGILFSKYGIYDFFGKLENIGQGGELATLSEYSVILLFLISGLRLDLKTIRVCGESTLILSIVPVLVEGFVMGIVAWGMFLVLGVDNFSFSIFAFWSVMLAFAMSSSTVVIPLILEAKGNGKKDGILDQMAIASILDNFVPFPFLLIFFIIATTLSVDITPSDIGIISIIVQICIALIFLVFAYFIGHIYGFIIGKIFNNKKLDEYATSLLLILGTTLLCLFSGPIGSYLGLIIGFGAGVGFNFIAKKSVEKTKVNNLSSKIYIMLFMPLIFIYVGTQLQISFFLDIINVILVIVLIIVAIYIKGFVSGYYLKRKGYTVDEQKLAGSFFAAKGIILINLSLILAPGYKASGLENVLQYIYLLSTIAIIVSIPYSTIFSKKNIEKID